MILPTMLIDEPQVAGELVKDQILITQKEMQHLLEQRGYGEFTNKKFYLKPFEALYLLHGEKLKLTTGKKRIVFEAFMQICTKHDEGALTKFLIYRDLRERGYVVKDGFGFDSDFRVYERGDFGTKGANYLVFGFNEGKQEKISSLQKKIEQITTMGKDPIIAVIERRGEVIYYKISRIKFLENKTDSKLDDLKL